MFIDSENFFKEIRDIVDGFYTKSLRILNFLL